MNNNKLSELSERANDVWSLKAEVIAQALPLVVLSKDIL